MKFRKKIFAILMAVVVIFAQTSCANNDKDDNSNSNASSNATEKTLKVGVSISTLNNPFFNFLKEEIVKNCEKNNIEVVVADAQNDSAQQANDMDDFIQQSVDAIIVNPVDSSAITTSVESANESKIPVITVDRASEGGEVLASIVSDNVLGGEKAGDYLVDKLGENAEVAVVEGIPGASATNERLEGFKKVADKKLKIVASQAGDFDRGKSLKVTEDILQSNPEIKGIFAGNDESALGVMEALEAASRTDIIVVGFDGSDEAKKSIKDGKLNATIGQRFDLIAKKAVESVIKNQNKEKVEKQQNIEVELLDKDNIK